MVLKAPAEALVPLKSRIPQLEEMATEYQYLWNRYNTPQYREFRCLCSTIRANLDEIVVVMKQLRKEGEMTSNLPCRNIIEEELIP